MGVTHVEHEVDSGSQCDGMPDLRAQEKLNEHISAVLWGWVLL